MPHYVVLVNFTDQGIRDIRNLPETIAANTPRLEAMGIKLTRYFTLGQYDIVALVEAPSDEVGLATLLGIGSQGNVRTTALKAFTEEEFLGIVRNLPSA